MPAVRAAAGVLQALRVVPDVFSRDGLAQRDPWVAQGELVTRMAASDPIADGLTKLRNASRAKHPVVELRASKVLERLVDVLRQEGFIRTYRSAGDSPTQRTLRVYLKYVKAKPAITQVIRVSKPGVRIYRSARALPRVLNGLGVAIVSTSRGIMSERDAYRQRIGGEVICYVW